MQRLEECELVAENSTAAAAVCHAARAHTRTTEALCEAERVQHTPGLAAASIDGGLGRCWLVFSACDA